MTTSWGRPRWSLSRILSVLLTINGFAAAYDLDPDSPSSVRSVATNIAKDLMAIYKGHEPGQIPGLLPDPPYYWWEAGALMGAMVDYWYYTGDDTYNERVIQAFVHQVGENQDYVPRNQSLTAGNDDQGFWGLAVMSATELRFPNPPEDQPQYLALAQAVFNTQASRWDTEHCGGGLRWQIFTWNKGWDYKNSISQGCFFALGARLALYTGNATYAEWAERTWDWMTALTFIDDRYRVFDGGHIPNNCTNRVPYQWTYNAGVFINGASAMYNYTKSDVWKERLDSLVKAADVFFVGEEKNIMQEVACETVELCNTDQQSFKAYLTRWLAATTKWAPHLAETIMPKLRASSINAASTCVGGENGRMCGLKWTDKGKWDGLQGVGPQMMAMQVTLSNIVASRPDPATQDRGGISKGDPGAGGNRRGDEEAPTYEFPALSDGDRAGAAIITALIAIGVVVAIVWLFMDETSKKPLKQRFFDFRGELAYGGGLVGLFKDRQRTAEEADEKGKEGGAESSGNEDAAAVASGGADGVLTPLPFKEAQVNSRRALDPIEEKNTNVIEREASGSGSAMTEDQNTTDMTDTTVMGQTSKRMSKRLSKRQSLGSESRLSVRFA